MLLIKQDGWELVRGGSGEPVHLNEKVTDFRGREDRVLGGRPPHKPGSAGRVWVDKGEFFPTVFDLVWRRVRAHVGV